MGGEAAVDLDGGWPGGRIDADDFEEADRVRGVWEGCVCEEGEGCHIWFVVVCFLVDDIHV